MRIGRDKGIKIFLDSGAFSAFTKKAEINMDEYIAFIKRFKKQIHIYSNLDVIGNPEATWKNQIIMEKAGLKPLPVFHYGSNIKWLKRIVSKYDYMAIGAVALVSSRKMVPWLDHIFKNYLCDDSGMPVVKVHGFAITSPMILFRYPWYSTDSSSWNYLGKLGKIFTPKRTNGRWDYTRGPRHVPVTYRSIHRKDKGDHFDTISPNSRKLILDYIHEKGFCFGKSKIIEKKATDKLEENESWAEKKSKSPIRKVEVVIERGISNDIELRDEINLVYFLDIEKRLPEWPWPFKVKDKIGFQI
jgi:hypothetical protein